MKNITKYFEAKQIEYRVALINCKNSEDLPINVTITVDSNDSKALEKYIKDEADNLFAHAEGGNLEEF